ncbi:MAG: hydrogenase small subunit [Coriobacteriia bacterium]|nr:hydrogenase small subunit [Coriobacteriia bacterium]
MPQLYERLAARGVSRRRFLTYCAGMAASIGLGAAAAPDVAFAIGQGRLAPAVWLNLGSCTGCTESLAQGDSPDVATVVLDLLSLDYAETLMAAAGTQAEEATRASLERGGHIAIIEGSVMTGEGGNTLRIGGRPGTELLREVCDGASLVIAVGSCAVDGGWVRAAPNPAGATGVADALPALSERLVNLPACPVNPEWIAAVLVEHLLLGRLPALDAERRPTRIYGATIHDGCPRRGHYENGEFVERFGTEEEHLGWCLYHMGCKGPTTRANCPGVRWNRRASWCVEAGSPCIGCASPEWVDGNAPFLAASDAVTPGIAGVTPLEIGSMTAAAAAGGFAAWGVREAARGQRRHPGAPAEDATTRTNEGSGGTE